MILSGHQPVYLPGIILFNKIALSDSFMFVGHCQFCGGSWQQRNMIASPDGRPIMLSVPTSGHFGASIDETLIQDTISANKWRRKHCASIRLSYSKRPHFHRYFKIIEEIIRSPYKRIGFLNRALIAQCCEWLEIRASLLDSWKFKRPCEVLGTPDQPMIVGHKTDMLIQMCKATGIRSYLSNEGARAYVETPLFEAAGLKHYWQKFEHPVYPQGRPVFIPNLSIIDLLFNVGPAAAEIVRTCGSVIE